MWSHSRFQIPEEVWDVSLGFTTAEPAVILLKNPLLYGHLSCCPLKSKSLPFQHFLAPMWLSAVRWLVLANELWVEVMGVTSGHLTDCETFLSIFFLWIWKLATFKIWLLCQPETLSNSARKSSLPVHSEHVLKVENKHLMFKSKMWGFV